MLSELRTLSQKHNKKHQSRKQKVSSVKVVMLVQREGPAEEEDDPLLLQRPERAKTLEKLEELGKEGYFQNKELPRPALKEQQLERNPDNQPGAPKEKKRKEQMIDLQNILTTKSPSVKSLVVPTTIEVLVSRAKVMGHCGKSELCRKCHSCTKNRISEVWLCWEHISVIEKPRIVWGQTGLGDR